MNVFLSLFVTLLPLYVLIGLGYFAGRKLEVNLLSIARINMFIVWPFVAFIALARMNFQPEYIILPTSLWCISIVITFISYKLSKLVWGNNGNANIVGAGSVNGNALYFGLPIILHLFGTEMASIYIFMNIGPMLNNMSIAYFLTSRGKHSFRDSVVRLVKFPALHAAWLGILVNLLGWQVPEIVFQYWQYATGTMVFLGMMMIGIAISKLDRIEFDLKLTSALFVVKFAFWPLAILTFIYLDMNILGLLSADIYNIMMVYSAMPLMGNLVAYASEHDLNPARVAMAVLASTLFAAITIPTILWFIGI